MLPIDWAPPLELVGQLARDGLELLDAISNLSDQLGRPKVAHESASNRVQWWWVQAPAKTPTFSAKLPILP
jgi:hypothetical protein